MTGKRITVPIPAGGENNPESKFLKEWRTVGEGEDLIASLRERNAELKRECERLCGLLQMMKENAKK